MPPKFNGDSDDDMMADDMMGGMSMPLQKYLEKDFSKNFMAGLPKEVRKRAEALLKYHEDAQKLQREMEVKEMELRKKYDALYEPMLKRRTEIITGNGPAITEEEIKKGFPEDHEGKVTIAGASDDSKGMPEFWLRVLHHHVVLSSFIEEHDEDALKHLLDISSHAIDGGYGSFEVVFTFAPNEFFEEEKLTMTLRVDETEGISVVRSPLTWKSGKNLTVEKVTKKQKAKKTGQVRTIEREVPRASFFTIFQEKDDEDEEEEEDMEGDEEDQVISLLQVLHNSVVPCAIRHYTGEAPDGSSDVEEDDMDDEEDDEDDEDY